jgi:hypothetical protein
MERIIRKAKDRKKLEMPSDDSKLLCECVGFVLIKLYQNHRMLDPIEPSLS